MAQYLASRISFGEPAPRIRNLPSIASAVGAFVGIAEMGPIGTPVVLTSFEEFVNTFGGFITSGVLALQVRQFFLLGGRQCVVVRTCHYTDITDGSTFTAVVGTGDLKHAATAPGAGSVEGTGVGPFDLEPSDTLVGSVGGAANQT